MQILNPDMAPVRFYEYLNTPDYQNVFPNHDNVYHGRTWIPGHYATKNYTDWIYNKTMVFQFRIVVAGDEDMTVYKNVNGIFEVDSVLAPVVITPNGWVSEAVYKYEWTPTEKGVYYIQSTTAGFRSEKISVHESIKFKNKLVEVSFYNTINDYGMIFIDNGIPRYTGLAYFTGKLEIDNPGNEISAFETDRGDMHKQNATPVKKAKFIATDIHYNDVNRINMILSCDTLTINGKTYQNENPPKIKATKKTDLVDLTVALTQTNYTYFTNQ